MNKEIKKILEQLEWYRKIGKKDVYYPECVLPNKKAFILLDYITNLQQENKQLKEELENDIDRYEDTISYQLGFDKGKEYLQQKIDKAIEYIKNLVDNTGWLEIGSENVKELLEILGDKENEEM